MFILKTAAAGRRSSYLAVGPLEGKLWLGDFLGIEPKEHVAVLAAASAIVEFHFDLGPPLRRDVGHVPSSVMSCHLPYN